MTLKLIAAALACSLLSAGAALADEWRCKVDEVCAPTSCVTPPPTMTEFALSLDNAKGTGVMTAKDSPDETFVRVGGDRNHTNWFVQGTLGEHDYSGDIFLSLDNDGQFAVSFHALNGGEMQSAVFSGNCTQK